MSSSSVRYKSRAVARFFLKVGSITSAEGTNLVGGLGVSSHRKFPNLEAPKRYLSTSCEKAGVFSAYNIISAYIAALVH